MISALISTVTTELLTVPYTLSLCNSIAATGVTDLSFGLYPEADDSQGLVAGLVAKACLETQL